MTKGRAPDLVYACSHQRQEPVVIVEGARELDDRCDDSPAVSSSETTRYRHVGAAARQSAAVTIASRRYPRER
jgi:hypothetical protein